VWLKFEIALSSYFIYSFTEKFSLIYFVAKHSMWFAYDGRHFD
jgi:hypothetical protein